MARLRVVALLAALAASAQPAADRFRVRHVSSVPARQPIRFEVDLAAGTPKVVDWNRDGLPDLVMLNHQGYLCLYRRERGNGAPRLLPPEKIFLDAAGRFLNLSAGRAGRSGRRKIELADWDGDGDLDLISDSDDGAVWYENIGSQEKPVMQFRGTLFRAKLAGHNPAPNVADWNSDGKLDVIVGAEDGFFYFFDRNFIDRSGERPPSAASGGKAGRLCNLETVTCGFLEGASE